MPVDAVSEAPSHAGGALAYADTELLVMDVKLTQWNSNGTHLPVGPPLISIVVPTYNRAHTITRALDSILAQTYEHTELIVVDDGSSDNTVDVVGSYAASSFSIP